MTEVYWLEQIESDVPAGNDWLSENEAARLAGLRFAKRRTDFRLGRWTAKLAIAAYRNLPRNSLTLRDIEIRSASSGAPEARFAGQPASVALSLSHRDGRAMCAVAPFNVALGCDLEVIEPRTDCFIADYFTAEERELVAQIRACDRPHLLALLWSGKESALKALNVGLRLDTRSLVVSLGHGEPPLHGSNGWLPLQVRCASGQVFQGWRQNTENVVRTLVACPPPIPPILLSLSPNRHHRSNRLPEHFPTEEQKIPIHW